MWSFSLLTVPLPSIFFHQWKKNTLSYSNNVCLLSRWFGRAWHCHINQKQVRTLQHSARSICSEEQWSWNPQEGSWGHTLGTACHVASWRERGEMTTGLKMPATTSSDTLGSCRLEAAPKSDHRWVRANTKVHTCSSRPRVSGRPSAA